MKWSNCAIEDLKKYNALKESVENIKERIEALETRFLGIKNSNTDKIPVSGRGSKWEDSMLDNIVERERLELLLKSNERLIMVIEKGLNQLTKTERLVLDRFFICRTRNHVEDLAEELRLEKSQIYRLKEEALQKFTRLMYGIQEY